MADAMMTRMTFQLKRSVRPCKKASIMKYRSLLPTQDPRWKRDPEEFGKHQVDEEGDHHTRDGALEHRHSEPFHEDKAKHGAGDQETNDVDHGYENNNDG